MQGQDTDRIRIDDHTWSVKCWNDDCGRWFEATRSDATYCSQKCRQHAARAPQRRANALNKIDFMVLDLREIKNSYNHSQEFYDRMILLRKSLDGILDDFDIQWKPQTLPLDDGS